MTPLEPFESNLPQWMRESLREPVAGNARDHDRIMHAVLAEARHQQRRRVPNMARRSGWRRRGVLSPLVGVITTLVMAVTVMMRLEHLRASSPLDAVALLAYTHVIGDSVVPRGSSEIDAPRRATNGARWLDTLRVVEFVLRGPSVRSASALGEFNRWQRAITPLARVASNEWRARVLVPRDALSMSTHVAVLVNGEQIVPSTMR
jgi:hypothetical protein